MRRSGVRFISPAPYAVKKVRYQIGSGLFCFHGHRERLCKGKPKEPVVPSFADEHLSHDSLPQGFVTKSRRIDPHLVLDRHRCAHVRLSGTNRSRKVFHEPIPGTGSNGRILSDRARVKFFAHFSTKFLCPRTANGPPFAESG